VNRRTYIAIILVVLLSAGVSAFALSRVMQLEGRRPRVYDRQQIVAIDQATRRWMVVGVGATAISVLGFIAGVLVPAVAALGNRRPRK
jgi:hypothetical protein